ncbi:hypothetical protein PINS_up008662 [Pythium insidiosum]|nr:hypothetical protein PINS_up008662 [Pythium insidiosum]
MSAVELTKQSRRSIKAVVVATVAVVAAVYTHSLHHFAPADTYWPTAQVNASLESHFTETYYQARALFRERARGAHATLHTLRLDHLQDLDLTIDVAVMEGSKKNVVVHVSGTHGAEGFAGSAIQSAALQRYSTWMTHSDADPTVIFVHALNPYGFAQFRRNNEHNVDLNRNWLSDDEIQALTKRDANAFGYLDVYDLLNPSVTDVESWACPLMLRQIWHFATKGWSSFKRAVVTGNYHFPASLFFGGFKKQPSIVLLEEFLQRNIDFQSLERFAVVDVHTGLGKSGEETLFLTGKGSSEVMSRVFAHEIKENVANSIANSTNAVTSGYDAVAGVVCDGIAQLVPVNRRRHVVSVAQEFGTVPPPFVLKAMVEENAMYHQAPTRRLPYAERARDVFYVHRSVSWKQSVLDRGVALIHKIVTHLQQQPAP